MKRPLFLLVLLSIATLCFGVYTGSTNFSLTEIFDLFAHKLWGQETQLSSTNVTILWNIRLPRVLLGFLVGGGLGLSGAIAQSVLQNPLASPYTLGVSSGASFGAALCILWGLQLPILGNANQMIFAFGFGVATILFVLGLSYRVDKTMSTTTVVLTGMVISLFFNGLLTTLTSFASEEAGRMELFKTGSFAMRGWDYVQLLTPCVLVGFLWIMWFHQELDLFSFGMEDAQAMGVNTNRSKTLAFLIMSILTGACISITGTIGFVDLISPHVARKFVGNQHKHLLPASFAVGGCLMVATDAVARTVVSPGEMPVGAVTSLLGAPFFFYVYQNKGKKT